MRDCLVLLSDGWKKAKFIGVFQFSEPIDASPLVGGHPGGVVAFPVAVVECEGELLSERLDRVRLDA